MVSLIYTSKSTSPFEGTGLIELCNLSSIANQKRQISGYLYYNDGLFLQYIEGEEDDVMSLFESIKADGRHEILSTVFQERLLKRRFPVWDMRWLKSEDLGDTDLEMLLIKQMKMLRLYQGKNTKMAEMAWSLMDSISAMQLK
ncbi:BLUF domain-containing protein [Persicobacter psychrovividus]|uniref:BLUF domain-containing protein n=1 Tax=Persicobacter psychrovividus TaxID=387638 RepID=A0ABM7VHP5_9BACT|nr:hypothetical protein PEPS_27790 [Persicobacter psychrovividus]